MEESIADKFLAAAKAIFDSTGAQMGSSPQEMSTSHGPVVDKLQFDRIMSYIDKGKASAQLLTGGKRLGSKGCFIEPTLFVNPDPQSPIWKEEVFGPVLTVRTFKTEEEAIAMANDSIYGLAGKVPRLCQCWRHRANVSASKLVSTHQMSVELYAYPLPSSQGVWLSILRICRSLTRLLGASSRVAWAGS